MRLEKQILSNLINDETYVRGTIAFLKEDYFLEQFDREVFKVIRDYINKYNTVPSKNALLISLQENKRIDENTYAKCEELVNSLVYMESDFDWMIDQTEKFCKDKAVNNAVLNGIKILDGKDKKRTPEAIPSILSEALAVSFDNHIGHDYIDDADDRFDWYHRKELRLPFDLQYFNRITKGGVPQKTLNVCLAGTGVGKSLFMCHLAASSILEGKNVLYLSLIHI